MYSAVLGRRSPPCTRVCPHLFTLKQTRSECCKATSKPLPTSALYLMCILKSAEIDEFFFLSARCGQRLLVEYEKSTERNTGSSIHGEKQQMGKKKAQKTATPLLNAHKYSRKSFAASIKPQVRTSPDLSSRRRTTILQLEVRVFVTNS